MPGPRRPGRPYFVMELVQGVSITEYCDRNSLSTRERWPCSSRSATPCSTPTRRGSSTATSSRPMSWSRSTTAACSQGHRLRHRQGHQPAAHREDALHALRPDHRHAGLHESGTGGTERPGCGHALRHLLAGRAALRTADRHHALSAKKSCATGYLEMQRVIREQEPTRPSTKLSTLGATLTKSPNIAK
jgi:hypothetical protein